MKTPVDWFLHTDAGLLTRILLGTLIFTIFAIIDFQKHGPHATRWREYSLLLIAVATSLLYGAINDQITVTISPEYFIFGKELFRTIGQEPTHSQLRWEAAKVGFKATWTVGLLFGVVLLLVNNPMRSLPRLRCRHLLLYLPIIPLIASACGFAGGWLGYRGFLTRVDSDFQDMVTANIFRPYRFMSAWGVHLGGYVGGLVGVLVASAMVIRRRFKLQAGRV